MRENVTTKAHRLLSTDAVQVRWATDQIINASVRGDSGIHDVRWSHLQGWTCSCPGYGPKCSHIQATRSITMRPVTV